METDLSIRPEFGHQRRHPIGHLVEHQCPGGVHHVDALAAGVGHDAGLRGELLRCEGVGHHQETDRLQTEFTRQAEVLDGHVGLGAVRGDAADRAAVVLRLPDIVLGPDARQHQEGDLGVGDRLGGDLDQFLLRGFGESVVEARSAEAVAVGHLDHRHTGRVQGRDDGLHLLLGELVTLVVRSVPQ